MNEFARSHESYEGFAWSAWCQWICGAVQALEIPVCKLGPPKDLALVLEATN